MKKKNDEKKSRNETGWAIAHLSHNTMELYRDIAVLSVQQQATIRPGHTHDTTWQGHDIGHDTTGLRAGHAAARARMAWPGDVS